MHPVQGSLVIDGGMIVIVQTLISQVSLIPWPFTKNEGQVYTACSKITGICLFLSNLVCFSLASHRLCEVNGAI